ncbi:hypothetical protein ACG83_10740 [Frankia sp. R43]|uniref:phage scaffolding protein n=1 Tax=Frankia sp. R43 TaxID=269536 RepID=UPI0006CA0A51|nr:hypothetical protein [Frankia sp. R43]KPM55745.1 hypothetical protein ACG83_10740 [Frankia sp. R43]
MADEDARPEPEDDDTDDAGAEEGKVGSKEESRTDPKSGGGDDDRDADADENASKDADDNGDEDRPSASELRTLRDSLARTREEARRYRTDLRKLKEQVAADKRKGESDHDKALREAQEESAKETEGRYKPIIVRSAAKAAFHDANAALIDENGKPSEGKFARLYRLLDQDSIEVDVDGEVTGLADQVEAIKADYPEFFPRPKPEPAKRPKADAADRKPEPAKAKTSAERLAALLG